MNSIPNSSRNQSCAYASHAKGSSFYPLTSPLLDRSAKPMMMNVIEPISFPTPSTGLPNIRNPHKEVTAMEIFAKKTVAMNGSQPNLNSTPSTGLADVNTPLKEGTAKEGIENSTTMNENQTDPNATPSTGQSEVSTPKNEKKSKKSKKPKKKKGIQKNAKATNATGQSYIYTPHKKGSALDKAAKPIVMNVYQKLKEWYPGDSIKEQVQKTSELTGVSERTIYRVKKEYDTKSSFTTHGEKRPLRKGKGTRLDRFDTFTLTAIQEKVRYLYQRNEVPTVAKIRNAINEDPRLPTLSICTTGRLLKDLGFVYEKTPNSKKPILVKKEKKKPKPKNVSPKKSPNMLPGKASLPVSAPTSLPCSASSFPGAASTSFPGGASTSFAVSAPTSFPVSAPTSFPVSAPTSFPASAVVPVSAPAMYPSMFTTYYH